MNAKRYLKFTFITLSEIDISLEVLCGKLYTTVSHITAPARNTTNKKLLSRFFSVLSVIE